MIANHILASQHREWLLSLPAQAGGRFGLLLRQLSGLLESRPERSPADVQHLCWKDVVKVGAVRFRRFPRTGDALHIRTVTNGAPSCNPMQFSSAFRICCLRDYPLGLYFWNEQRCNAPLKAWAYKNQGSAQSFAAVGQEWRRC